jgi:hypothetical protein
MRVFRLHARGLRGCGGTAPQATRRQALSIELFMAYSQSLRHLRAMNICALVFLAACLGVGFAARAEPARRHTCYSTAETRDKIVSNELSEPFHVMRNEASRLHAEAIGAKLCRWSEDLVYEISLLRHDGRVIRVFVNAKTSQIVGSNNED